MRIEIHEIQGFWPAIWGMRNPMQSHDRMDSEPPEEADFAIHEDEDGFVNGEWEPPCLCCSDVHPDNDLSQEFTMVCTGVCQLHGKGMVIRSETE